MITEQLNLLERFYVSLRPGLNESHPVHREGCPFLPVENKRIYLGEFNSVIDAKNEGIKYFDKSCGCRFCSNESLMNQHESPQISFKELELEPVLKFLN